MTNGSVAHATPHQHHYPLPMDTYAIGDLQACAAQLDLLLDRIEAASPGARLVFVGDLVNRGPASLQTLRTVMALGERALCVLGNHDLHLLAVSQQIRAPGKGDTLDDILHAPDRDALLGWLRRQPLARMVDGHLIVHAGVLPAWTTEQAIALSQEVEAMLQGERWVDFLRSMYGNEPARWSENLHGADRLRCIVNAMTRIRFCTAEGQMEFQTKEGPGAPPAGFMPWFEVPGRHTANHTVVFGHWSTLGLVQRERLLGLDTGCVWGGKLSALKLAADPAQRQLLQVDCPQHRAPG
jgi:bis(5'-nucleosyl)-tetraphosphatase (symmetrical)